MRVPQHSLHPALRKRCVRWSQRQGSQTKCIIAVLSWCCMEAWRGQQCSVLMQMPKCTARADNTASSEEQKLKRKVYEHVIRHDVEDGHQTKHVLEVPPLALQVCVVMLFHARLRRTCTMHARFSSSLAQSTFQPCGAGYGCTRWRSCCCVRRSREPVPRSRYEHAPHQRLVAALTSSPLISTAFLFLSLQDLVSQHKDSPTTARQSRSWLRIELWRSIAWTCISLPR
jgi:hypothetical protein